MFGGYLLKKLIQKQLKGAPPEAQEMIMNLIEKHPDKLMLIAQDFEAERKTGKSDQNAMMAVMRKHEVTLKGLLQ